MRFIRSSLITAAVAMLAAPVSAQSLNDSYDSFRRSLQDSYNRESVADLLNRQRLDLRQRAKQDAMQNDLRALEAENSRLRGLRAQERDQQRRRDAASGIWSPARSQ